jgi:catechol 2,3-dioxygenase
MQAKAMRIGHIGLAVRDLDAAIRFYTEVVGLSLTERFDYPENEPGHGRLVSAGAFVRCDSTHHCISIFALKAEAGADQAQATARYGLHHIAFEMKTPEDLLSKYQELCDKGVSIVSARRGGPGNQPRFYANDLDGNLLEFYWGIDEIGWQGTPRAYPEIEEISLEEFDFEEFVAERERAANGVV